MTAEGLPPAAQQFIGATNAEDRTALLAAFAETGTVDDFGRTFTGPQAIGAWSDRENIGTHSRITVDRVSPTDDGVTAGIAVTGSGYNGTGSFEFQLADGLIQRLTIRG